MPSSTKSRDNIVIEVVQATKVLPHGVDSVKKAFMDLSFVVERGQRIALFSGNAYESRTLLDCLSGVETPDQGSIVHHGSVSWPVGTNQAFNKKLSGYMNARFAAELYSQPGRINEDLLLIQEIAGVDERTFHEPLNSWRAQTRRSLELAVSLAFEFDVTLVGKINAWNHRAPDPRAVRIRKLFEQRTDGRALVIAAPGQDQFALDYCDEGVVIFNGRIAYRGDPEVCREMVMEEALRLRVERRMRVNARNAQFLSADSEEEDDVDSEELSPYDSEHLDSNVGLIGGQDVPASKILPA